MKARLLFEADAALANPEFYEQMESMGIGYAIRLPANEVLQRDVAHLLVRPTRWPFQLAEVMATKDMFDELLGRIGRLRFSHTQLLKKAGPTI